MSRGLAARIAAVAAALGLMLGVAPASAQQQPDAGLLQEAPATAPVAVGVIDIQTVLRQSSAAQGLQQRMQEEQDRFQEQADLRQRELQIQEEAIERERPGLTQEAYAEKRREFQDRVSRTTIEFRGRRRQIDEAFNEASSEINRTLLEIIEDLAEEQGIQLVVRREAVLYQRAVADLTQAVSEALNVRLPEIAVLLPPASP